jgi:hypothetical protein
MVYLLNPDSFVIPAKAEIQFLLMSFLWIPACAGMAYFT